MNLYVAVAIIAYITQIALFVAFIFTSRYKAGIEKGILNTRLESIQFDVTHLYERIRQLETGHNGHSIQLSELSTKFDYIIKSLDEIKKLFNEHMAEDRSA